MAAGARPWLHAAVSATSAGLGRLALYEVESREPFAVVPACRVLSLPYRRSAIVARLGGVMPAQVESGVAGSNVADSLSVVTSLCHAPAAAISSECCGFQKKKCLVSIWDSLDWV